MTRKLLKNYKWKTSAQHAEPASERGRERSRKRGRKGAGKECSLVGVSLLSKSDWVRNTHTQTDTHTYKTNTHTLANTHTYLHTHTSMQRINIKLSIKIKFALFFAAASTGQKLWKIWKVWARQARGRGGLSLRCTKKVWPDRGERRGRGRRGGQWATKVVAWFTIKLRQL